MTTTQLKQRVRITVLGPRNAGKTALVFRYLARLPWKGAKNPSETISYDNIYNHCVCLDHVLYDLEIVDLGHPKNGAKFEKTSDAFVVVYSLASKEDFEEASEICQHVRLLYPEKPVLLVGNKADLERQVDVDEGHQLNGELFVELSATRDNSWEVHQAMYLLLRKISEIYRLPVLLKLLKSQAMVEQCEYSLNAASI